MAHTIRDKSKLLSRVRRIRGQADALERALVEETDCAAILQQIAAIRGAVNGLMAVVLEGHLRVHVAADGVSKKQREDELEDVLSVLRSYVK
jgi:DNA-binding FrmR family transcriptional regulator